MQYIDLTHTVSQNTKVYPDDPKPKLKQIAFINKDGHNDFQFTSGMHIGTHIDAAFHMFTKGKKLSDYPTNRFFGKGHLIDARKKNIDEKLLEGLEISKGDIVLVMTGFYKKFKKAEYFKKYPEISEKFASKLIKLEIGILGIDTPSPDHSPFKIHKLLLKNDILIIENLTNLEKLLKHPNFTITALPIKLETDAAAVRVIATIF